MSNLFSSILKNDVQQPVLVMASTPSEIGEVLAGKTAAPIDNEVLEKARLSAASTFDGEYEVEKVNVIDLIGVSKSFGDFKLFDNLSFSIPDFRGEGQFISILGQSGSGKSQILRLVSGLSKPDKGEVRIYGKKVDDKTSVPMVFQQYSSFPWMTVLENVALPMKLKGVGKEEREAKARSLIKLVGLEGHEEKWAQYPSLSGGQLQRVSLARNLATNSQIMLLDEATSALDIFSKRDMQQALLDIFYSAECDPTIINVTHDVSEAVMLSNRIYILQANPCRVFKVIDVKFDERRTQATRNSGRFADYVNMVETAMDEVNKLGK